MLDALTGIGEGSENGLAQKLPPQGLPEALDIPQRHRVVGSAPDVSDSLLLQHSLETRLTAPGYELAPVVRQDLARSTPLPDRSLHDLEHGLSRLLPEQAPAYQKA
jgi:hypothetical protein